MIHSMGKIDYAQEGECKKSIATVRRYSRILFLLVVMSSVVSFVTFVSLDRAFVISSMNLFFQLSPQNEDRYLQHEHVWSDNVVSNKNRMSSELTVVVPKNYHSSSHRISSYSNLTHEHEATASRRLILSQATKLSSSAAKTTTIFYATGDVPYSTDQASKLKQQLLNIPSDAEFIIHVGDIRNANGKRSICRQEEYTNVASLLRLSPVPVFILRKYVGMYVEL